MAKSFNPIYLSKMLEKTIKKLSRIFWMGLVAGSLAFNPIASNNCRAEIYKYKDESGVWHYTDGSENVPGNAETINEIQGSSIPRIVSLGQNLNDSSTNVQKRKSSQTKDLLQAYVDFRNYETVLHKGISLFSDLVNINSDYRKLDDIIREARKRIPKKASTAKGAVKICRTIGNIISEKNYRFNNRILKDNNCRNSYIYVAIGESLNLPINLIVTPEHVFVRYFFDGNKYINWDAYGRGSISDSDYVNKFNISQTAINNGVYMTSISKRRQLSKFYREAGDEYKKFDSNLAIAHYNQSIDLSKKNPIAYHNRGNTWTKLKEYSKAKEDYSQALNLDPNSKNTMRYLKIVMSKIK